MHAIVPTKTADNNQEGMQCPNEADEHSERYQQNRDSDEELNSFVLEAVFIVLRLNENSLQRLGIRHGMFYVQGQTDPDDRIVYCTCRGSQSGVCICLL